MSPHIQSNSPAAARRETTEDGRADKFNPLSAKGEGDTVYVYTDDRKAETIQALSLSLLFQRRE
jgi:hypothetical protein